MDMDMNMVSRHGPTHGHDRHDAKHTPKHLVDVAEEQLRGALVKEPLVQQPPLHAKQGVEPRGIRCLGRTHLVDHAPPGVGRHQIFEPFRLRLARPLLHLQLLHMLRQLARFMLLFPQLRPLTLGLALDTALQPELGLH